MFLLWSHKRDAVQDSGQHPQVILFGVHKQGVASGFEAAVIRADNTYSICDVRQALGDLSPVLFGQPRLVRRRRGVVVQFQLLQLAM